MSDADTNSMVFYFFQYLPYIFLAILFAGMAPILVTLNSRDMKARTACSALPGRTRTLAMASGCLLYSLGIWLLFLLLGLVFYRKDVYKRQHQCSIPSSRTLLPAPANTSNSE